MMEIRKFIDFLGRIEKLKCNTRHSWTSTGRHESVAEHSWRLAVMAMLCADEFPDININKVIKMCLIHDFGEAVTGDIPAFLKTIDDEKAEAQAVRSLISELPNADDYIALFEEMDELMTPEARLWKALDKAEALVSHNEADISTWLPREYEENLTYGQNEAEYFEWTRALRKQLKEDSIKKITAEMR